MYVEPDPDEIRRLHPNAGPARNRDRRQHEQDARPTIVGTHTDQLDAWMYRLEGTSPYDVDKPIFNTNKKIQRIVDFLADGHKPGWFRFGADLLGLAGPSQKALADAMEEMVKKTRNDDRSRSLVQGYAGMWGYPTFPPQLARAVTRAGKRSTSSAPTWPRRSIRCSPTAVWVFCSTLMARSFMSAT